MAQIEIKVPDIGDFKEVAVIELLVKPGDTVAVWGCGPVGLFAIKSATLQGAGRVIAIDRPGFGWSSRSATGWCGRGCFRRRRSWFRRPAWSGCCARASGSISISTAWRFAWTRGRARPRD